MTFGLNTAPGKFQRVIGVKLSTVKWKLALVYLDDYIIFSGSPEEHIEHTGTIIQLLKTAGVSMNLNKCVLFSDKVDYLGHVIGPGNQELGVARLRKYKD